MKSKGIIIAVLILLSILIFGLVMFLVLSLNGKLNFKGGIINFGVGITKSSNVIFDENYEINDIKNIEILSEAGDIKIEKSSEQVARVVVYGEKSEDLKVSSNQNELKVDYTKYKKSWFNFGTLKNDIIIYIPENYSNEINIKTNYGDCDIASFENATLNINNDSGNVSIGKIKNITLKCDYGNIKITSILNKCDIKCDCGNVEIDQIKIQENSKIRADLGNVNIKEINDIYIDAKADLGNSNVKQNNRNSDVTLEIKADFGNITVGQ